MEGEVSANLLQHLLYTHPLAPKRAGLSPAGRHASTASEASATIVAHSFQSGGVEFHVEDSAVGLLAMV